MTRKISLCLTNYNRYESLIESFQHVYDDDRISEIIISDDCSDESIYNILKDHCQLLHKIKLHRNDKNLGMSLNKAKSVSLATNPWVIIFDSDNVIKKDYIDRLYDFDEWSPEVIYQPDFAYPNFDFRSYGGKFINKETNKIYIDETMYSCFLNACNYFVHKDTYLRTYEHNPLIKEVDTMWHNYNHLKAGGLFYFVPDMQYTHTVHEGSGWLKNANENMAKAEEIKKLMMGL